MTTSFPLDKKIEQLEKIEKYFQEPDMNLENAIEKQKEAMELAKEILTYLETAENTLSKIDIQALRKDTL